MSPRRVPAAATGDFQSACGRVIATEPAGIDNDVYWRLDYYVDGRRKQTTGGRTRRKAEAKMAKILEQLDHGGVRNGRMKLDELIDKFDEHLRKGSDNHRENSIRDVTRVLDGCLTLRAEQLTRTHVRDGLNGIRAESTMKRAASAMRAFLKLGAAIDAFSDQQKNSLEGFVWTPVGGKKPSLSRKPTHKTSGRSDKYVSLDQVPTHAQVVALGEGFQQKLCYGRLMIEHTAACGFRQGELFALDVDSIDLGTRRCGVDWQVISKGSGPDRLRRPKGNKVRVTDFMDVTLTGYHLLEALTARIEEVEIEHAEGRNPMRLLYPAPMGGWWWATGFDNDFYAAAATAAGFKRLELRDEVVEDGKIVEKVRRQWVHTMHNLRHRFARDRIDHFGYTPELLMTIGGWESAQEIWDSYYKSSEDALDRSAERLRAGPSTRS